MLTVVSGRTWGCSLLGAPGTGGAAAEACAGGARGDAGARSSGELGVGLGHVGRAALLAADDELDRLARVVKGVEHSEKALARNAEGGIDAMHFQRIDEQLAAAAGFQFVVHDREEN